MLKGIRGILLTLLAAFAINNTLVGQTNISPYTVNGLGDINSNALTTNLGMGGLGVSNGQNWYLNNVNPALLTKNTFTVLEAGMVFESRRLEEESGLSQSNSGGGLSYFAMAFPIINTRWTSSLGIMPYSTVNFNILSEGNVVDNPDIPVNFNYKGDGGLTQAYFSNGFRIAKNLSLGLKTSILFGSIVNETLAGAAGTDFPINFVTSITDKTSIRGFTFSSGLAYRIPLKENSFINTGFTYDFQTNLNAKKFKTSELRTINVIDPISIDTITNDLEGTIVLPSNFAVGISYEKLYKFLIGADFRVYNWSDFENFDQTSQSLVDNYGLNVGVEYTPDVTSVDSYFKRVTYRFGVDYQKTPFEAANQQLSDFGINFGVSFPIKGLSTMNLALKYGQRGTTDDNLIKENYFRVNFGISFNDRWFQRRVVN